jgi:hypothetical protein
MFKKRPEEWISAVRQKCHPDPSNRWAFGPPKVDEKRPLSSNHPPWKRHLPLCHLDRSVPRFPTSQHSRLPRMRLSVEKGAQSLSTPPSSTGNPGERSGEISLLTTSPGNVFRESNRWAFSPPKVMKNALCPATTLHGSATLPFVISTEAYPDFLPHNTHDCHACGFP